MHPDLSSHLHSPDCQVFIEALQRCHAENKFKKFLGACNDANREMLKCFHEEREAKRQANHQKARERQERMRNKSQEEK